MQLAATPPALLRYPILALTLSLWAVLGFFFWVPLLARSVAVYCAVLLSATLTATDIRPAAGQLQFAIGFWVAGFHNILATFQSMDHNSNNGLFAVPIAFWRVVRELIWSLLFWFLTLRTFGLVPSPRYWF